MAALPEQVWLQAPRTICVVGNSPEVKSNATRTASCYRGYRAAGDQQPADHLRTRVPAVWTLTVRRIRDHPDRLARRSDHVVQRLARRSHVWVREASVVHLVRLRDRRLLRV